MNSRGSQFALAVALVVAGGASSASAQQSIIFSRPVENGTEEKANAFLSADPSRRTSSAFNAPTPLFGVGKADASYDFLPGASPLRRQISPTEQKAWDALLESKKKWAMMTPEEILGVPTAEKILGIPEKKADANLSVEQRYLKRQERATAFAATNGYRGPELKVRDANNPFANPDEPLKNDNPFARLNESPVRPTASLPPKFFNDVFGRSPNAPLTPQQRQDSAWGNTFGLPPAPAKPTPEQLAGMERFRAMMEPSVALEKTLPAARTPLPAARDSYLEAPLPFNPLGGSAKSLRNETSHAKGIAPLPSLVRQPLAKPPVSPSQAQLPPWLRDDDATPKPKVGRF